MKTDVFELTNDTQELETMLSETEKAAVYSGLDKKQSIRLRLLAEELIGMLPELLEYIKGQFWIESKGKAFELHISATLDDMFAADREKLLSISTSGENAAAKGVFTRNTLCSGSVMSSLVSETSFPSVYPLPSGKRPHSRRACVRSRAVSR